MISPVPEDVEFATKILAFRPDAAEITENPYLVLNFTIEAER